MLRYAEIILIDLLQTEITKNKEMYTVLSI